MMPRRKIEPWEGGRPVPKDQQKAKLLEWSRRYEAERERRAQVQALARRPNKADSESVRFAMRAIEQRIVRGLWVLEISQSPDGPKRQTQHGIAYLPEYLDRYGTIASGGEWTEGRPTPAVPSNKEIDAALEAKSWISWLDEEQARLLNYAAITKRGDRRARVKWDKVKARLRLPDDYSIRTLQDRYDRCLRTIVAELSHKHICG